MSDKRADSWLWHIFGCGCQTLNSNQPTVSELCFSAHNLVRAGAVQALVPVKSRVSNDDVRPSCISPFLLLALFPPIANRLFMCRKKSKGQGMGERLGRAAGSFYLTLSHLVFQRQEPPSSSFMWHIPRSIFDWLVWVTCLSPGHHCVYGSGSHAHH